MKNGWYKAIYKKDNPISDYWEPGDEIVYIKDGKIRTWLEHRKKLHDVVWIDFYNLFDYERIEAPIEAPIEK